LITGCVLGGINRLQMILTGRWYLVRRLPLPQARVLVKVDQVRFNQTYPTSYYFMAVDKKCRFCTNRTINQSTKQPTNKMCVPHITITEPGGSEGGVMLRRPNNFANPSLSSGLFEAFRERRNFMTIQILVTLGMLGTRDKCTV